ncbi:MAG: Ppx/GppA phosphatase family protein [Pseudomonadota bacterium]
MDQVRQASEDRRRSRQRGGGGVFAALDLGTNNCRLLIARPSRGGFQVIDAFSRIVRLGEGLSSSGALSEAAIERALEALMVCAAKLRRRRVTRLRAIATEACRQASNGSAFLEEVYRVTGIRLEIISAEEEAALTLTGCAPLFDHRRRHALVFDIGGGSTEVSHLHVLPDGSSCRLAPQAFASLPFGVVTLVERYGAEAGTRAGFEAIVDEVADALDQSFGAAALAAEIADGQVQMLGSSGTVTTLTGMHLRLPRYDRRRVDGATLTRPAIDRLLEEILEMSPGQRAGNPCIGPQRAEFVVSGCAILAALCQRFPVPRLRVADRGVREGILLSLMRQPGMPLPIDVAEMTSA